VTIKARMLLSRHHSSARSNARSLGDVATAVTGQNDVRETTDGTPETSVATRNVPYPARTARLNVVGSSSHDSQCKQRLFP
jgi:hypothetical protein